MASVRKKTFTKPIPPDAELFARKGPEFARWKDSNGRAKTAKVTTAQDGTKRLSIESATYVARYRDGAGIVREVSTGCRDRDAAIAVLNQLVSRSEKVKSGILSTTEDAIADHQRTPINEHVKAYLTHLLAKGVSEQHHRNVKLQLERIVEDCGFAHLRDMDVMPVELWMKHRQDESMAGRTRNTYLAALKGFANWCVRNSRLSITPFAGIAKADERIDQKRQRRALTEVELQRLLSIAQRRPLLDAMIIRRGKRKGQAVARVSDKRRQELTLLGRERALIYKTLVLTGLRKSELASITVGQLDLDGPTAYIVLHAADEKSRKGAELPLRDDLASDLRGIGYPRNLRCLESVIG